jgi:cytochrome P450
MMLLIDREHPFQTPPELGRLREHEPISRLRYPDGHHGWLVTSYTLARAVLTDARFSMMPPRSLVNAPGKQARLLGELNQDPAYHAHLLRMDPPEHTRIRRLFAKMFTAREIGEHRERIEGVVAERLDAMEAGGPPTDLVETLAEPVALMTHCALYGIPHEVAPLLRRRAAIIVDGDVSAEDYLSNYRQYRAYLTELVREKRTHPADDLTSFLAGIDGLTEDEIVGELVLLFDGGFETTASMLSLGTLALLCHRKQWQLLVADPSLVKTAVEELLRFLTVFQYGAFSRTATEDVELGGSVIKAGDAVAVSLLAANHDPERFQEPDALNITRAATGQLAFGQGVHMCLGQHQARLEMQIVFGELARRFPALRLAVPIAEIPFTGPRRLIYSVDRLPVAW